MAKTITIKIGKDGNAQIDVKGVKGRSCVDLTQGLEEAIGKVVDADVTPEFYAPPEGEINGAANSVQNR